MGTMMKAGGFTKVSEKDLYTSEPPPQWFGNPENEKNAAWTNTNWLKSRFHFSFAEYSNARRNNFGPLRVMNDDLVQPSRGFGAHPHRDAEIVTYIVQGQLTHKDSMGTRETLGRGSVQFMTAGSGVTHSEHNLDAKHPLRFIQMWFTPRRRGLTPNYGGLSGDKYDRTQQWALIVGDVEDASTAAPVKLHQDINMFAAELKADGVAVPFELKAGRIGYLLCMEGAATVAGAHGEETLQRHEAAHLAGPNQLTVKGDAHMLLIEMTGAGNF